MLKMKTPQEMVRKCLDLGMKKMAFSLIGQGLDDEKLSPEEAQALIDSVTGAPGTVLLNAVLSDTGRWYSRPGAKGSFARYAKRHF